MLTSTRFQIICKVWRKQCIIVSGLSSTSCDCHLHSSRPPNSDWLVSFAYIHENTSNILLSKILWDLSLSMQPSSTSRNHVKRPATPASQCVQLYYDHGIVLSQWRKCCIVSNSFLTTQHIYKLFSMGSIYTNTGYGIRFWWLGVSQVSNDIIAKNNHCFDLRSYHKLLRSPKVKCFIIIGRNEW